MENFGSEEQITKTKDVSEETDKSKEEVHTMESKEEVDAIEILSSDDDIFCNWFEKSSIARQGGKDKDKGGKFSNHQDQAKSRKKSSNVKVMILKSKQKIKGPVREAAKKKLNNTIQSLVTSEDLCKKHSCNNPSKLNELGGVDLNLPSSSSVGAQALQEDQMKPSWYDQPKSMKKIEGFKKPSTETTNTMNISEGENAETSDPVNECWDLPLKHNGNLFFRTGKPQCTTNVPPEDDPYDIRNLYKTRNKYGVSYLEDLIPVAEKSSQTEDISDSSSESEGAAEE